MKSIFKKLKQITKQPEFGSVGYNKWIEQNDFIEFLDETKSPLLLYASFPCTIIFSLLLPKNKLNNIESLLDWDCCPDQLWGLTTKYTKKDMPTFKMESPYSNNKPEFLKYAFPIIYNRYFNNEHYFELDQRIAHIHDLHYLEEYNAFCKINNNGDVEPYIERYSEQSDEKRNTSQYEMIIGKRELLDLHMYLSKSVLIRFFDSTRSNRFNHKSFNGWGNGTEIKFKDKNIYARGIQKDIASFLRGFQIIEYSLSKSEILSLLGCSIQKEYETFIIYDFRHDKIVEHTCNPEKLTNYFNYNDSEYPFETSPMFFNPEVLSKYKNNPDKYNMSKDSIGLRNNWHLGRVF